MGGGYFVKGFNQSFKKSFSFLLFMFFVSGVTAQQENVLPESGRVGIGTLNPSAKLDVNGKMFVDSAIWLKGEVKMSGIEEMENQPTVGNGNGNGNGNGGGNGNSNGNNASQNQYKYLIIGEDGIVRSKKHPNWVGDHNYRPLTCDRFSDDPNGRWNSGTSKLFTCPPINVGINIENPRTKLDVVGRTHTNSLSLGNMEMLNDMGSVLLYVKSNQTNLSNKIAVFENNSNQEILTLLNDGLLSTQSIRTNGSIELNTNLNESINSKVFVIQNNGRKILQLNNNGLLQARQLKVNLETSSWADYVFKPDYKLLSLENLEKFINDKGHLPNVPSEKTIKTEGIDVGEMNRILLEKIEELTLYLIEQDKKIKTLEKQIKNR
jgi:hypothetical protein